MKHLSALSFSLLFIAFFTSCHKEHIRPEPGVKDPVLTVLLNPAYLAAAKVDSAVVSWQINGRIETMRFQIINDSLITRVEHFTPGRGKLTIVIFSQLQFQQSSSQWVYENELTLDRNKSIVQRGPQHFHDTLWSPRAILKDGIGHLAIVALRPDDPYFFIRNVDPSVKKLVVARYYWKLGGGVSVVAGKEWQCFTGCTDEQRNVLDQQYFRSLTNQIGNRAWNHIEIDILYLDQDSGGGYVLMLNHTLT